MGYSVLKSKCMYTRDPQMNHVDESMNHLVCADFDSEYQPRTNYQHIVKYMYNTCMYFKLEIESMYLEVVAETKVYMYIDFKFSHRKKSKYRSSFNGQKFEFLLV
ncbi:uncharacterized protein LOC143181848 [Calliopsis andreniformis]|uniref:uncharacterized protein LOC143181848 n=1 Tax=Calliopsis andreniformis TaxID=337506 RepID=UPI003FCD3373